MHRALLALSLLAVAVGAALVENEGHSRTVIGSQSHVIPLPLSTSDAQNIGALGATYKTSLNDPKGIANSILNAVYVEDYSRQESTAKSSARVTASTSSHSASLSDSFASQSGSSSRYRHQAADTVVYTLSSTTTNATLASELCGNITSTTLNLRVTGGDISRRLMLPDCVFSANMLDSVDLASLVIQGNTSHPDPIVRFPSALTLFRTTDCLFLDPTSQRPSSRASITAYYPRWTSIFTRLPNLDTFNIYLSNLAGTLPPTLPVAYINSFKLQLCELSGSIPSTFFALAAQSSSQLPNIAVSLQGNRLTGTLPAQLMANLVTTAANSVNFDFSENTLSGTLPAGLFAGSNFQSAIVFLVNLGGNNISGVIDENWFPDALIGLPLQTLFVNLSGNSLTGTIPRFLVHPLNATKMGNCYLYFSNNQFTGELPSSWIFSGLPAATQLRNLVLDVSFNNHTAFPGLLLPSSFIALQTVLLNFNNNQLAGTLPASLISALPDISALLTLRLSNNALTGSVAPNFISSIDFSTMNSFSLFLDNNQLTGTPFDALLHFPATNQLLSVEFDLSGNLFSGRFPETTFCQYCVFGGTTAKSLAIDVSNNDLIGGIPQGLFSGANKIPSLNGFSLDASSNNLGGALPQNLFEFTSSTLTSLNLNFDNCSLGPSMPTNVFNSFSVLSSSVTVSLSLASNVFSGNISSFIGQLESNVKSFSLNLNNNTIEGTLDDDLWTSLNSPSRVITLFLSGCGITAMPSMMLTNSQKLTIDISRNAFSGALALNDILSFISRTPTMTGAPHLEILADHNAFDGALTLPTSPATIPGFVLSLFLSDNKFSGLSLAASSTDYLADLDVSYNTALAGSIPNSAFSATSILTTLNASHTALSGVMPDLSVLRPPNLYGLDLSSTSIDFCSAATGTFLPASTEARPFACNLTSTSAELLCRSKYPSMCFAAAPLPTPSSSGCLSSTRPSDQFTCINGVWVATATVSTPVLNIPGGAPQTVIDADVESTSIVFNGLGTTLVITGCANNLTKITVTLTPEQLKSIKTVTQQLLSFVNSTCSSSNIDQIQVETRVTGSSCRKASVQKATSNGTLSGLFTIDSSKCNTWWIILVAVVASLVVIAVFVFIMLVIFVPRVRNAVRPYSKSRGQGGAQVS